MPESASEPTAVDRFVEDLARSMALDVTKKIVYIVGGSLLGAFALLIWRGGSLPAWSALAALVLGLVAGLLLRRRGMRKVEQALDAAATRRDELEEDVDIYTAALIRHEEYSGHVAQALDALQRILSDEINVEIPHYVEVGVLQPARDLITDKPAEHVRLSVLLPDVDDESRWEMLWAAGHSVTGKAKYDERIVDTLSRHAYETGVDQHWHDTSTDSSFRQNPLATHETRSLISLPVRHGDETVGVFNVVSSEPHAFDPAEEKYIASLGAVIAVAVGVWAKGSSGGASNTG